MLSHLQLQKNLALNKHCPIFLMGFFMKRYCLILLVFLTFSIKPILSQIIPDSIVHYRCLSDTTIEYEVFLPLNYDKLQNTSFIIFFDPHGKPSFPINLYKNIATELGLGLIGFCNSKNGDAYNAIASKFSIFWNDIDQRFHINRDQIAFCGFSGGAKVSAALSLQYHPSLLIACGADPGISSSEFIRAEQQSIFFIGTRDFNFYLLFAFRQVYESSPLFHLIINRSKHQWPLPSEIKLAFYYFLLKNKSFSEINEIRILESFKNQLDKRILQLDSMHEFMAKMDAINDAIYLLNPYMDVSNYIEEASQLNTDSAYISNVIHFTEILKESNESQKELINALNTKDTVWWSAKLSRMATDTTNPTDNAFCDSQHRLFAFLGILMYSMTTQSIANKELTAAAKYLWIYSRIEPNNPDMLLNYAKYYALQKECFKCQAILKLWINTTPINQESILKDTLFNRCLKEFPISDD